jgi:hypothetical protein
MNLQLFAEDVGPVAGGDNTAQAEPGPASDTTPAPSAPSQPQSLAEFFQSRMAGEPPQTNEPPAQADNGEPEPPAPDAAKPEPPEPRVDIPDKFKNPDGSPNLEALVQSYREMESVYTRSNQVEQFAKLQQMVINLQQQIARQGQQQQVQTQAVTAPQAPQPTKEELDAQAKAEVDKFWEDYSEDPRTAITKLVQNTVKNAVKSEVEPSVSQLAQKVEPIIQNAEYQTRVEEYHAQVMEAKKDRPDFDEMLPEMRKVIDEFGDVLKSRPDAVVMAYNLAKARQAESQQPAPTAPEPAKPPTVEEMLNDQEMVAKLVQNPALKNLILTQHMQEIKNNPAPPVIGANGGGIPPSTQPVDLKDIKSAKEALKAKYAGMNLL